MKEELMKLIAQISRDVQYLSTELLTMDEARNAKLRAYMRGGEDKLSIVLYELETILSNEERKVI